MYIQYTHVNIRVQRQGNSMSNPHFICDRISTESYYIAIIIIDIIIIIFSSHAYFVQNRAER